MSRSTDLASFEFRVLIVLDENGPLTEKEIGREIRFPADWPNKVKVALESLSDRGLVESDLFDGDIQKWDSTSKGHTALVSVRTTLGHPS